VLSLNKIIKVKGLASNKLVKTISIPHSTIKNISLMDFLRANSITIASSCNGEGTCKKCVVNNELISCQISLENFTNDNEVSIVEVAYL
jgi:Na+-transporting NADH:ubiquinone oxidoreductase subunit NqrF